MQRKESVASFYALSQKCEKRLWTSLCVFICPYAWNSSAPTGNILSLYDIRLFSKNWSRKFQIFKNLTRMNDSLHEDLRTFTIASR